MAFVRYYVGDVVKMKKAHPCGSDEWEVKRIGVDFSIECKGCGHRVMIPRPKFEKAVKKIIFRPADAAEQEAAARRGAELAEHGASAGAGLAVRLSGEKN